MFNIFKIIKLFCKNILIFYNFFFLFGKFYLYKILELFINLQ